VKKRGKKGKTKRGKKWEKNGLVHLHFLCFFFCFFDLLFVCFCFALILLFSMQKAKKQNKSKTKAKKSKLKKQNQKQQKCKWTSPFFPIFSPFLTFLFFPFMLLPDFFGSEVLLFDFPCVFLFFFSFFKV
jgi:uncharacterized membrane protein